MASNLAFTLEVRYSLSLFNNFKALPVIANALLKPGFNIAVLLLPPQYKTLTAIFTYDFHFYPHKKGTPSSITPAGLLLNSGCPLLHFINPAHVPL